MKQAVIVSAVRTAVGRAKKGTLRYTRPENMGAEIVKEAIKRAPGLKNDEIDDVIIGNAMPEAAQGLNMARYIGLHAGLPDSVPALTVNRFCASGLQTIAQAAAQIKIDEMDVAVAGGVESMSMVPMGGMNPSMNPDIAESMPESYISMGHTAERVAKKFDISREEMDQFAVESHRKAIEAIKAGKFKDEILPIKARHFENNEIVYKTFDTDECPREGTTMEVLAKLRPVFNIKGQVTAGNSSPTNDGASAVVIMSEEKANALKLEPLGYFKRFVSVGVPPDIMGIGPLPAITKLLERENLSVDDIDLFEINEAFASQALYVSRELKIPADKLNVNGGAIALGHPLGCTGAKLTTQLLYEMKRQDAKRGVVSMCIGGGMGAAALIERK